MGKLGLRLRADARRIRRAPGRPPQGCPVRGASRARAGLSLPVIVNALWSGYDVWAKPHRHDTLSRQMHDWIFSPGIGPFIIAGFAFFFVLLIMHFTRYHAH